MGHELATFDGFGQWSISFRKCTCILIHSACGAVQVTCSNKHRTAFNGNGTNVQEEKKLGLGLCLIQCNCGF